jgi:hypothetical protein
MRACVRVDWCVGVWVSVRCSVPMKNADQLRVARLACRAEGGDTEYCQLHIHNAQRTMVV